MKMKRQIYFPLLLTLLASLVFGVFPVGSGVAYASPGWVNPTDFVDSGNVWTDEAFAYDEGTGNFAYADALKSGWTDYLELTHATLYCDKVQVWVSILISNIGTIEVDVYYDTAWHNIYSGAITVEQFVEYPIGSTQSVESMRIRFDSSKASTGGCRIHEADFNEVIPLPSISNSPGNFDFGVVTAGSTPNTTAGWFTITNSSNVTIDINIKCDGWSFTAGSNNWIYGASAPDTARLKASNDQGGVGGSGGAGLYDIIVPSGETGTLFCNDVATSTPTIYWELQFEAPSSFTHSDPQITTVTLTATQA